MVITALLDKKPGALTGVSSGDLCNRVGENDDSSVTFWHQTGANAANVPSRLHSCVTKQEGPRRRRGRFVNFYILPAVLFISLLPLGLWFFSLLALYIGVRCSGLCKLRPSGSLVEL